MASLDAQHYYQIIRDELRENIVAGRLPHGTMLFEAAVADRLGVSRPPVRRALELLANEGIVHRAAGRGFIVGEPGRTTVSERRNLHALPLELSDRLGGASSRASWEGIYDEVEANVLACSPFGMFQISEAALGQHFDVSRTVVRDVLNRMHGRNLIGKDRRSHWIAGPLGARMLDEHHELRSALEPQALASAAPGLDRAMLAAMRERVRAALAAPEPPLPAEVDAIEADLHIACLARLRNQRLLDAVRQTQIALVINRLFGLYLGVHDETEMLLEHRLVFDHLGLGDGAGAAAALVHHLNADHARARARLKVLSVFGDPEIAPYLIRIH
jgi:DNA-binding GntR family transcriptional regulator